MKILPLGNSRYLRRRVIAFALAIALPPIAADINHHFAILQYIPFALYFVAVTIVASLGGTLPSLVAVALSILARSYTLANSQVPRSFDLPDIVAAIILGLCGLLANRISDSRRRSTLELNERTQALIDSLHSGKCASWIVNIDRDKSARWYSGSYPVFGRPFAEIEKLDVLFPFLHLEDQQRIPALIHHMRSSSEPIVFEHRVSWPEDEIHWLECRGTRIPGSAPVWRGVTVDVTERKLTEAALLRSEKLAAMGRLASTVAHEINNPLEAVTNLLYLARTDPDLNEETRTYLSTAEAELARLGNITRLTLGFVRTSETRTDLDLSEVVDNVLTIFRPRYEMKHISIERIYQPDIFINVAHHELRQVITNLIANAIDAISTPAAKIVIHIQREHDTAVLLLEDNGSGIDDAHLARIFEPFFTTKEDTGTGIGLWVTRELVHKNGGNVSVESGELQNGIKTRFRVEFPLAPLPARRSTPWSTPAAATP